MPEGTAKKPIDKSRRAVILATVGIVVILGLSLFFTAFLAPLLHTRAVLKECRFADEDSHVPDYTHRLFTEAASGIIWGRVFETAILAQLGNQARAFRRLSTYLRLPDWLAPDKMKALHLLGWCGEEAVPILIEALDRPSGLTCDTHEDYVREIAAQALGQIGPAAREAIPALERAKEKEDSMIFIGYSYVDEALKKIRGGVPDAPSEAP